jgi:hypothetical protein
MGIKRRALIAALLLGSATMVFAQSGGGGGAAGSVGSAGGTDTIAQPPGPLSELNAKCEAACKTALDKCAAVPNKIMDTASKEAVPYKIDTPERERADIKLESAFQASETCRNGYDRCAIKCRPSKACIDACHSRFHQCFAAGERKMQEGLREIKGKRLQFGSPEWQTAYTKGDRDINKCLENNRSCEAKCINP